MGNFAIFGIWWTQLGIVTTPSGWRSLRAKGMGVSVGLPVDHVWNTGSDLQAGVEIYYWSTLNFGSFQAAKMTQFWDPNFPFRVVNWRAHFSKPIGSPDLNPSCTLRYKS